MYNVPYIANSMVRPSRWLFSCSLHVSCPTHACFTSLSYVHSDFPACLSQVAAGDCSQQIGGQGLAPLLVSLVTNEPIRYQLPHNHNFPLPEREAASPCSASLIFCNSEELLWTCFWTCKIPPSITPLVSLSVTLSFLRDKCRPTATISVLFVHISSHTEHL